MNEKKPDLFMQDLEEEEEQFYETIDPAQPSTSNRYMHEKFHYAVAVPSPPTSSKNRLRAQRQTSKAVAEAAIKNGMQTVDRSGSSFVVPITMQAHPTQLNDRILAEKDDILSQSTAFPYCCYCHSIFKTWRGFEYHVLQVHLKYRPFRCFHCQKESFYTEEEGRFHSSTCHPNEDITLVKEFKAAKETEAQEAFKSIFLMCRDGPEVTRERVFQWEQEAFQQVMKFHYLKFKRPIVVTKKLPTMSRESQTEMVNIRMMIPPLISHEHQTPPIFQTPPPQNISLGGPSTYVYQGYHQMTSQPRHQVIGRPRRSTATQHDEDPSDRDKRVAALMLAVTSSNNR
ncbi:hypothetical protein GCK72_009162 [Caenorhabditis remanei]|uniref:C2H2-type domain-containing protein n=1 Tax=Caenorhabditis remanei TaxID=31234 RepID=A0A6A5GZG3_CAERE|nr:hypothetical protein GCK72_009162 [Caenorhabditis remanei]KAF1760910.1 hypothetical protein GCK72_009162 [Caenorhabditis remanei]